MPISLSLTPLSPHEQMTECPLNTFFDTSLYTEFNARNEINGKE